MRYLWVAAGLLMVAGCAYNPLGCVTLPNPLPIPAAPPDFVWEQVVDVVDDYFEIEHEERGRQLGPVTTVGRIDTFPAIGSTIFEPWKGDSVTCYERVESTLQSMRRRAVVQVVPAADGGSLIEVQVFKELEDMPSPEGAPTAAATFRYDNGLQRFADPVGGQPVPLGWIGQGRDPGLEQRMLQKIFARLGTPPPPPPAPGCKPPWWVMFAPGYSPPPPPAQ